MSAPRDLRPAVRSSLRQRLRVLPGIRALRLLRQQHFGQTPENRESARLQRMRPDNLFQPSGFTMPGRYPHILRHLQTLLEETADRPLRLLSFGCSIGLELEGLDARFPGSVLTGIDISTPRLAEAAERLRPLLDQGRLQLIEGGSADCLPPGLPPFDAVLAMSVFRHHDLETSPPTCSHRIRFADFERTVTGLTHRIRSGGFLCITNANFDFAATAAAAGFAACVTRPHDDRNPLYGPDDTLQPMPLNDTVIFRKT